MSQIEELEEKWNYWYPRVYGYFYKRVDYQAEVEDLTANTMNTAFTAKNVLNFQAYIWRVAHNYLVKYINTKNTAPTPISLNEEWVSGEFQVEAEETISDHYTQKISQLMECVQNNIKDPEEQKLIQLSVMEEKNSTQIATILNLKADNIRQKLSRLLKRLRQKCIQLWPMQTNQNLEDSSQSVSSTKITSDISP
jgi:RNA polymerase sigma factor (sigma-70 family)